MQAGLRGMLARAEARRIRRLAAATKLQAAFRRYRARSSFLRTRWAVLVIQCAVRGRSARAEALLLRYEHTCALWATAYLLGLMGWL